MISAGFEVTVQASFVPTKGLGEADWKNIVWKYDEQVL
jgi:hypothetical protein